jgi:hypothetical protein
VIQVLQNDPMLGGFSYVITSLNDAKELPSKYNELITDLEINALSDHKAFFSALHNKCAFYPMKSWLYLVAASESISLTLYIDDMKQRAALVNVLGVSVVLKPSSSLLPVHASRWLWDVFDIVGSIHECGFGESYVLEIGEHGVIEEFDKKTADYSSGPAAGSYVTQFYTADCGDRLLAVGNQVFHYHIGGSICEGDSVEQVLTQYFRLLSGTESSFSCHIPYGNVKEK